jgi:hypothetical protein
MGCVRWGVVGPRALGQGGDGSGSSGWAEQPHAGDGEQPPLVPGSRRSIPRSGISSLRRTWPQAGSTRSRRRPYKTSKQGGVLICETPRRAAPRHAFGPTIISFQLMCSVWPTAAMLCCARLLVIHRCILSRWDASGLSVSVSITVPWPWNTRAIWSGSGSVDMLTTTGCSGSRRPSPGMSRFPHMSQGVGSTKPQSAYGQQAGAVRRSHLYLRRTKRYSETVLIAE